MRLEYLSVKYRLRPETIKSVTKLQAVEVKFYENNNKRENVRSLVKAFAVVKTLTLAGKCGKIIMRLALQSAKNNRFIF